jgi:hypothetical protein
MIACCLRQHHILGQIQPYVLVEVRAKNLVKPPMVIDVT